MAFCKNCGTELAEGAKFCTSCGAPQNDGQQAGQSAQNDGQQMAGAEANQGSTGAPDTVSTPGTPGTPDTPEGERSVIDKFGSLYGIALMILSFIDVQVENPIFKIVFSAVIIIGCFFCFGKKYKLKFFTIVALVFAIGCLLTGISNARYMHFFRDKTNESTTEDILADSDTEDIEEETDVATEDVEEFSEDSEESIEEADGTSEEADESVENTEEKETAENKDNKENKGGVDPDLKAFLDSYESFIGDYVDFMKKYTSDSGNALSMMVDYTKMMAKYADFGEKLEAYDEKDMSDEDLKYYLEVINRCNAKMLEIY